MYLIVTAGVEEPLQPLPGISSPPHSFLGAGMMNQDLLPDTQRNKEEGHYNLSSFIGRMRHTTGNNPLGLLFRPVGLAAFKGLKNEFTFDMLCKYKLFVSEFFL